MEKYKLLAVDETGKASYSHHSTRFILMGVIMPEESKPKIDAKMRKVKKKYFRDEEIVFHSRDMSRNKGPFKPLEDSKTELGFWSDFISVVNSPEISLVITIVDKISAKEASWQPATILKRSYLKAIENFSLQLKLTGKCGKIICESDPSQDLQLINAHNKVQGGGTTDGKVSADEYRKLVTSLSFVNKSNSDVDVQIADALAPIAGMKYEIDVLKKAKKLTKTELSKKRLIDRKLSDKTNPSYLDVLI
ncbi:MAG: DUF3800 domain-containing protein [Candidatus Berkelbacteria bacterium]|nr:DUF3800 domain-containing protein [Candidatus Berkelbacteria bacterium]